ncbi:porin [Thalassospira lucentensis]|uniref:porin n=1 Tax=Thalassospira lucentensis TaxID=168935 RepID=UPI003AA9E041
MKKILFASSAIAAVAFAGQASASEPIKLSLGGYMEQWVGFSDEDRPGSDGRNNAFQSDTEVYFDGETILDNGIQVGAHIELEGETSTDQVDEQFLYVSGGFGRIEMGKNDGAADAMGVTAPTVGPVNPSDGGTEDWVNLTNVIDTVPSSGDQNRVTWFTPNMGGFQAGFSVADDSNTNGSFDKVVTTNSDGEQVVGGLSSDTSGNGDSVLSAAVAYDHDFDGFSLGLSLEGESQGNDEWYGAGVNVGFGNFTVGGSYGHVDPDARSDTNAFDLGLTYAMDAASVGVSYAYQDDNADDIQNQGLSVGMAYTLGAGVSWQSSVFWFDEDTNGANNDNDGYGAVTGLALNF